jgi:hypothetical protein
MDWIEEANKKRKILEKNDPLLFRKVAEILFKHDLMGIDYEVNTNEYEPEAGTIIPQLENCSNAIEVRKVIYEEFIRWFYDDVGSESEYTVVAAEIWDVWSDYSRRNTKKGKSDNL